MNAQHPIIEFLEQLADIAASARRKLAWFVGVSLVATLVVVWQVYSGDSVWWWNFIKCGTVLLPILVLGFIWSVVGELQEVPELASSLVNLDQTGQSASAVTKKKGVLGIYSMLRTFRQQEGLEVVFDTLGNVTLMSNPFFALLTLVMTLILVMFVCIAPLLLFL